MENKDILDLSNEELCVLAQNNPNDVKYAHALFEKNKKLLTRIAFLLYKKYTGYNGYIYNEDDYIYAGYEVILRVIRTFDNEKGFKFTTYLSRTFENYILDTFFHRTHSGKPREMCCYTTSLNAKITTVENKTAGNDTEIIDLIKDDYSLENDLDDKNFYEETIKIMRSICKSEREFQMLYRRLTKGETLEKIGNTYGLTRERVRQITEKLTRRLRKELIRNESICR